MEFVEMIKFIEEYYSKFTNDATYMPIVAKMIKSTIDETGAKYEKALELVLKSHSMSFRCLPDVAIFATALKGLVNNDLEVEAIAAYDLLCRKVNYYQSIVFEDLRITHALESLGGLCEFCMREAKYEKLTRDKFIESFKRADAIKGKLKQRIFIGNSDNADDRIIMVGEQEKIKQQLGYSKAIIGTEQ